MGLSLDGADVTSAQQAANSFVNLSTEALEDTQTKIGAVDASTPIALGAVVNMVTKSGTNTTRGSATLSFQREDWNSNNVTGGTAVKTAIIQPEFSLGGPIVKDRFWFFGAYRYQRRSTGIFRSPTQVANLKALYPAFEEFDSENYAHYSFLKGTARFGPKHLMSGSYQRDFNPSTDVTMFDSELFNEGVNGGPAWAVNLSSVWNAKWVTRLAASYNSKAFQGPAQCRARQLGARARGTPGGRGFGGLNAVAITESFDLNLDGTFETVFRTPASTTLTANRIFDPKRHQPFADELIVGYRRQFPGELSVDAAFTRRDYKDLTAAYEVNGICENSVFRGYSNVTQNEIFLTTNNSHNSRVYQGFDLQAAKQTRSLQFLASYARQWRHVAGTWQPNDAASFIQPDAFPNDKGIGSTGGTAGDSLSGNHMALAEHWRDHAFRSGVSYQAPWQLRFAANYNVQSGTWSGPIVTRLAAPDPRFGPTTVAIPASATTPARVVSNPLATTIRYAFPTRGDGQFKSPTIHNWNVRVGRDFAIGHHRLEAAVDVFNVMNLAGDQQVLLGGNQQYNNNYQKFSERQPPRSAQLFLRYSF